jgi:Uma2 family endonuclease
MMPAKSPTSNLLTWEAYLQEGYIPGRYDIVEGVRVALSGPTWEHQCIVGNLTAQLRLYEKTQRRGKAMMAPFDVLIRRQPQLQARQPDVFFISNEQLERGSGVPTRGVLEVAPELVVEIISDSETEARVEAKISDYIEIGVRECWRVWPETRTVEVLRLSSGGAEVVATYHDNETVRSLTFPDFAIAITLIFAL